MSVTEKDKTLSENIEKHDKAKSWNCVSEVLDVRDVKKKIQNAQKRLREEIDMPVTSNDIINKIFKEEFGEELIC